MTKLLTKLDTANEKRGPGRPKYSSGQTLKLLSAFEGSDTKWRYGYDLWKETGIAPGTIYPLLKRLEADRILESKWTETGKGTPPRKMYRLAEVHRV